MSRDGAGSEYAHATYLAPKDSNQSQQSTQSALSSTSAASGSSSGGDNNQDLADYEITSTFQSSKNKNRTARHAEAREEHAERIEKIQKGWYMYDVADSAPVAAFNYFIPTLINSMAKDVYPDTPGAGKAMFGYLTAITTILTIISYITACSALEYAKMKRPFLWNSAAIGSVALFLFITIWTNEESFIWIACVLYVIAKLASRVGGVCYDAMLDSVAMGSDIHKISAKGYRWGYLYGNFCSTVAVGIWFVCATSVFGKHNFTLYTSPIAIYGVWWMWFANYSINSMEEEFTELASTQSGLQLIEPAKAFPPEVSGFSKCQFYQWCLHKGFMEQYAILNEVWQYDSLKYYIIAWLFISDSASVAFSFGAIIMKEEPPVGLGLSAKWIAAATAAGMIAAYCTIYCVEYGVANGYFKAKSVLTFNIIGLVSLSSGILWIRTKMQVMVCASVAGGMWGSLQTFQRSVFVEMVPAQQQAPFMSLFELTQKGTSWIGNSLVASLVLVYGNDSFGWIFFSVILGEVLIGLPFFLLCVDEDQAKQQRKEFEERARENECDTERAIMFCGQCDPDEKDGYFDSIKRLGKCLEDMDWSTIVVGPKKDGLQLRDRQIDKLNKELTDNCRSMFIYFEGSYCYDGTNLYFGDTNGITFEKVVDIVSSSKIETINLVWNLSKNSKQQKLPDRSSVKQFVDEAIKNHNVSQTIKSYVAITHEDLSQKSQINSFELCKKFRRNLSKADGSKSDTSIIGRAFTSAAKDIKKAVIDKTNRRLIAYYLFKPPSEGRGKRSDGVRIRIPDNSTRAKNRLEEKHDQPPWNTGQPGDDTSISITQHQPAKTPSRMDRISNSRHSLAINHSNIPGINIGKDLPDLPEPRTLNGDLDERSEFVQGQKVEVLSLKNQWTEAVVKSKLGRQITVEITDVDEHGTGPIFSTQSVQADDPTHIRIPPVE